MNNQLPEVPASKTPLVESVIIKLLLICLLTLLLLIPSVWIQSLIEERQNRQQEVNVEIADKWGGNQKIGGPVLAIPYKSTRTINGKNGKITYGEFTQSIYVLPEVLDITCTTTPELRHRGIFDAVVYNAVIKVKGRFSAVELKKSGLNPALIEWSKATIALGISDIKGLKNNPVINIAGQSADAEPDFGKLALIKNNLVATFNLSGLENQTLDFNFNLDLRGSGDIGFLHLGKITTLNINGNWSNPKFIGRFLPETTHITPKAFSALWKLPYFNRDYPQQWLAENSTIVMGVKDNCVGVQFLLPVDQYQKTMRSAKYAILVILLTFISLFFTEMLTKKKVHLLQYTLIGAAMTVYYTLLLSFSEQFGFNLAYLIASVATIVLIGSFIYALIKNKKATILLTLILAIFYGFIFVIIQLQDLALLFGSIGLFIIVVALMQLSQKINWYRN